ncbi:hypothetical protein GWK47_007312 [Chionoecetes opilio]|uniref:MARVEL domain-containing protein n=1 Tax=Chionoecetes opilio TaxID=41210 RepID=A0A8J4Y2N3_CHIOP|nr:hypothetical protein GWK47_007312 [Chionoecetes opilio]
MQLAVLKTPSAILKMLEIGLTIIIISVSQGVNFFSFGSGPRTFFCGGVLVLALVVSCLLLATYLMGSAKDLQKTPFELMMNAVLAVLMMSAGAVTINTGIEFQHAPFKNNPADAINAAGSLAIINSVFYGIDTYFAKLNMD